MNLQRKSSDKPILQITLSGKKNMMPSDLSFTPHKIQWKSTAFKETSNNSNAKNKTFFTSMKNQLSSLKSDVEKMLKKQNGNNESSLNTKNGSQYLSQNQSQDKFCNGLIKTSRSRKSIESQKNKKFSQMKLYEDQQEKVCNSKDENIKCYSSTKNMNSQTWQFEQSSSYEKCQRGEKSERRKRQRKIQVNEHEKQKNQIHQLQQQLQRCQSHQANETQRNIEEIEKLMNQVRIQKSLIGELKTQNKNIYKDLQVKSTSITQLQKQSKQVCKELDRSQKQRLLVQETLHNQECSNLRLQIENEELRRHNNYIQDNIQELNGKISILAEELAEKEDEKQKIKQNNQNIMNQMRVKYEKQVNKLKQQLIQSQKQREEEKNKFEQKQRVDNFKNLGKEFEDKIQFLHDQNYALKNKIVHLQSNIQKSSVEISSMKKEIEILEDRDRNMRANNKSKLNYEKLLEEVHSLNCQKQKIIQDFQHKIMMLENTIDSLKQEQSAKRGQAQESEKKKDSYREASADFNKILKSQLQENQSLKNKHRDLISQIMQLKDKIKDYEFQEKTLTEQIQILKMKISIHQNKIAELQDPNRQMPIKETQGLKFDLQILKKKQESLSLMLESKNKQIKSKDQFIQKVLISKTGKPEEVSQMSFLLDKLRQHISATIN